MSGGHRRDGLTKFQTARPPPIVISDQLQYTSTVIYILVVGVLVGVSGLFSGLTLGLMSLNPHEVKRKADLGDVRAKKIYPVRRQGNRLLVTLLLGNVAAISVLS